ncbi:MAG: GNAT family N-acetyltransferase [Candidatus Peribacteraceae bacterium]|nr:GNAT family N-acetyltransferase [Candidatus Peribacteraceae bacterium]
MKQKSAQREKLVIREMELEDLAPVYHLGEQLFTAERWKVLYRTWNEYEVVERFLVDGDYCFVAEIGGKIVGFVIGTVIDKRRSAWSYGYMLWLGVERKTARSGVGKRLVEQLSEAYLRDGYRIVIADTAMENKGAIRFFLKSGFEQTSDHVYFSKNLQIAQEEEEDVQNRRTNRKRRR